VPPAVESPLLPPQVSGLDSLNHQPAGDVLAILLCLLEASKYRFQPLHSRQEASTGQLNDKHSLKPNQRSLPSGCPLREAESALSQRKQWTSMSEVSTKGWVLPVSDERFSPHTGDVWEEESGMQSGRLPADRKNGIDNSRLQQTSGDPMMCGFWTLEGFQICSYP